MATSKRTKMIRSPKCGKRGSPDWHVEFLAALEAGGDVLRACAAAGIGQSTVYDRRKADEAFAKEMEAIQDRWLDQLEACVIQRAIEGVERPVMSKGLVVATTRDFDAKREMFVLSRRRPDRWGTNIEVTLSAQEQAAKIREALHQMASSMDQNRPGGPLDINGRASPLAPRDGAESENT